ncbi:MAG: hypothetical protein DA328_09495 [Nitrososphaeraceae archaeon]|nr:hypothetical protein [Nitrososphaeraceae archaeon]
MKINNCDFPDDVLYDVENFTWIKNESDTEIITVGIIPILTHIAGKISAIKLKKNGTLIEKDMSIGSIESSRYFTVIRSPIKGEIVEINNKIIENPKIVNNFPYGNGWFVRLKVLEKQSVQLQGISDCHDKIKSLIEFYRVRCFKEFPDHEMFEIGEECSATLVKLDELLEKINVGEVVHLVSDDITADIELTRWSQENSQEILEISRENRLFHFLIKKLS